MIFTRKQMNGFSMEKDKKAGNGFGDRYALKQFDSNSSTSDLGNSGNSKGGRYYDKMSSGMSMSMIAKSSSSSSLGGGGSGGFDRKGLSLNKHGHSNNNSGEDK